MLETNALGLTLGDRAILQDINLQAHCGELTLIIGPNGAGKSTLLSLLSGLRAPSQGQVRLCGQDPQQLPARELALLRAVVEQTPGWQAGLLACELVMMGAYLAPGGRGDWQQAMRQMQCEHLAQRRLETLSGGERQRVHLARALLQLQHSRAPQRMLLLDEPTAALDFGLADSLMAQLRQLAASHHLAVIAVVHDINLALRHADRVLLLAHGHGAACGPAQEVMQKARLEAIYGVQLAELNGSDAALRAFVPWSGTKPDSLRPPNNSA